MKIASTSFPMFPSQSDAMNKKKASGLINPQDEGTPFQPPTQQELKLGFFGDSRARVQAAMNAGYLVSSLAVLTASDLDLIQKTTGITIKDDHYYNADGTPATGDAGTKAVQLAWSLSEMRLGTSDTGAAYTVQDLQAYLKIYAQDAAKEKLKFDVVQAAEEVLRKNT